MNSTEGLEMISPKLQVKKHLGREWQILVIAQVETTVTKKTTMPHQEQRQVEMRCDPRDTHCSASYKIGKKPNSGTRAIGASMHSPYSVKAAS